MKDSILSIINELKIVSADELALVLTKIDEDFKTSSLSKNLSALEHEKKVFKIKSSEIENETESFILGPNAEVDEDIDIKNILLEKELFPKPMQLIKWDLVSRTILTEMVIDIETLKENILKQYKDSKALELEYFDLSLRYHENYNYFHQNYTADFLLPVQKLLNECRSYLDNLEF